MGYRAEAVSQEIIITSHPAHDPSLPFGVVVGADPLPEETRANAHALIDPLVQQGIVPIAAGFMDARLQVLSQHWVAMVRITRRQ